LGAQPLVDPSVEDHPGVGVAEGIVLSTVRQRARAEGPQGVELALDYPPDLVPPLSGLLEHVVRYGDALPGLFE